MLTNQSEKVNILTGKKIRIGNSQKRESGKLTCEKCLFSLVTKKIKIKWQWDTLHAIRLGRK